MTLNIDIIKDIAQRAALPPEKVLHESLKAYLVNKKNAYMLEKLDTLARYGVNTTEELENKIKIGNFRTPDIYRLSCCFFLTKPIR